MSNCPNCNLELTELYYDVTGTCSSSINKEDVKAERTLNELYNLFSLLSNVEFGYFRCVECNEVVAKTEEEAREFLK